jgi:hypothetical protein
MRALHTRWHLVLAVLALAACGTAPQPGASAAPGTAGRNTLPFAWVEGRWRWANQECDSAFTIQTPDARHILLTYPTEDGVDSAVYRVLSERTNVVRGEIEGEERMDDRGRPVVWDFVRLSDTEFCWHRGDWADDGCTRPLVRCAALSPGRDARADRPAPSRFTRRRVLDG